MKMEEGDKVKYTGKGFIGFDWSDTEMIVVKEMHHDVCVKYKDKEMLVRKYEVEK